MRVRGDDVVRRRNAAFQDVNLNKNRYTDVLPCKVPLSHFITCPEYIVYNLSADGTPFLISNYPHCKNLQIIGGIFSRFLLTVDSCRVVLKSTNARNDLGSDYINASFIKVFVKDIFSFTMVKSASFVL